MNAKKSVMSAKGYAYPEKIDNSKIVLKLEYNESQIPPSPKVRDALLNYIKKGKLEWYPEGDCSKLRESLSKYTRATPQQIIVGNGSDEILKTIAFTYLSDGDEIVMPVPNYSMFKINAELVGAKLVLVNDELNFSVDKLIKATTPATKVIYLSNPNSPTGKSLSKEDLIKLLSSVQCMVVVDEAYYEFYGVSAVDLISKYRNLIVTRTFSKAFSIAALRLGYAISQKQNIAEMLKVKDPESVNSLAQIAGIEALNDWEYVAKYIDETKTVRKLFSEQLKSLGIETLPSDGNFLLAVFPKKLNATKISKNLKAQGILVRNRSKEVANSIRIAVPLKSDLNFLIDSIRKAISPLLIFDMDGVLVDVSNSYREVIKKTVEFFTGAKCSEQDIQALKNEGGYNCDWDLSAQLIKRKGKDVSLKQVTKKFQELYWGTNKTKGLIENESWLFDKKLLQELSLEYNLAIVTGRPKQEAEYALNISQVKEFFSTVICMEDITKGKPSPEGILKVMSQFPSQTAYYFGDTIDDMVAAIAANAIGIGVLPPGANESQTDYLMRAGAKQVIDSINKLSEVLK